MDPIADAERVAYYPVRAPFDGTVIATDVMLSKYVDEEVDLGGIGRLLAVTPNDELNRLAALEYAGDFGRADVYQLRPLDGSGRRDTSTPHIRGRLLFGPEITYNTLTERITGGAQFKKTGISDAFTFEDFRQRYGDSALVMFVITESGLLSVATAETPLEPISGETVIALVDPVDPEAAEEGIENL